MAVGPVAGSFIKVSDDYSFPAGKSALENNNSFLKEMVRRRERCLGSRLKHIKSNKDDPIVIDDNTEDQKFVKLDVVFETPEAKMSTHDKGKQSKLMNEEETSYDVPLNDSFKDNLPITKRRLFESVLKGKGKAIGNKNASKERKIEKVIKGREEKKENTKKLKKSDKKQEMKKQGTKNVKKGGRKSNKKVY
uniref:Uncharacterized protein n=1 Tax=Cucumis melo TaxID=3656 RepID=A0A9I9EE46_CUCME